MRTVVDWTSKCRACGDERTGTCAPGNQPVRYCCNREVKTTVGKPRQVFTRGDILQFVTDLNIWFDDYVKEGGENEWGLQLDEVFTAGYGEDYKNTLQDETIVKIGTGTGRD